MEKTYNIVFETPNGPYTDFEFEYLEKVLFGSLNKVFFFDNAEYSLIENNPLIIYSCDKVIIPIGLKHYLRKYKEKEYALLHLSNESQNHLSGYYSKAKVVFRSAGWNPNIGKRNVYFIPLGFQSGYWNENSINPPFEKRDLIWSFAGQIKTNRLDMLSALGKIIPNFNFTSQAWGSKDQKTIQELVEIYKRTVFAPTPFGNINFECFRTCEALEYGCIPVTTKFLGIDAYRYIYGDHPFIVENTWQEAAMRMNELLSSPDMLKTKQQEVWDWYIGFKKDLGEDIKKILNGNSKSVVGKQFSYQQQASLNWSLRWRFFKHFTLNVYWNRLLGKAIRSNNLQK